MEQKNLVDLFDMDLFSIKFNILKDISYNRKKTYAEILYEILMNLYIKTDNKIYFSAIIDIFIFNENFKNAENKTILYHLDLDSHKSKILKNSSINKILKNYDIEEDKYFTITFLYKSLKLWMKTENIDLKNDILSLISSIFIDANLIYKEYGSKIKKIKAKNELYLYIKELLEETCYKNKYKTAKIEEISINFKAKYYEYQSKKRKTVSQQSSKKSFFNFLNNSPQSSDLIENLEKIELNDSFSSCSSTKSTKELCKINKKKKMKIKKKKTSSKFYEEEEIMINTEKYYSQINKEEELNKDSLKSEENPNNIINPTKIEQNKIINNFNLNDIDSPNKVILFPKLSLLEQIFAPFFTDIFFYNEPFINMKYFFKYRLKKNYNQEI